MSLVRALVNKAGHIRHCEEMLISLVQKKNYSARNCLVKNSYGYDDYYDFSFELNYHLGNYYFLISGCIDIVGRLLSSVYEIKQKDIKPNIEREEFQTALKDKSSELYKLYSKADIKNWMVWLKRRRNYVAHESEASYTDILKPKKQKLSDIEVKKKVDTLQNWNMMRLLVGDEAVEANKQFAGFVVRMKEDNSVLTREVMVVSYYDNETKTNQESMYHPLVDIKYDSEKIEMILKQTSNLLVSTAKNK